MADDPLAEWLESQSAPVRVRADAGTPPPPWRAPVPGSTPEPAPSPWSGPFGSGDPGPGLPDFDEERPRRRRLIVLAVAPWILAATLGLFLLLRDPAPPVPAAAPAVVTSQEPAAVGPRPPATAPAAPRAAASRAAAPPSPAARALSATATLAVRDALSKPQERGAQYIDHVDSEHIEWVGDVAIVTVLAAVLEERNGRWSSVRPARFAVPLQIVDGAPAVVGQPWSLAPPQRPPAALQWTRAALETGSAESALAAAGYRGVADLQTWSTQELPDIARVTAMATAPGERDRRRHDVWVRLRPEPAVLGER